VPIDRETTVRQAEKLQRQGRPDLAIAEYVRLLQEQPRDWNAINALGDLYLLAGDVDRAVGQFVQIADHLFNEGFFPKAAAVYKKALKSKSDHEHTLLRLAEIAAAQELLADARAYLRRLWELRSERGDGRGAAECLIRLALLPEADAETLLAGARASKALEDTEQAVSLFRSAAEALQRAGRAAAALDALSQVVALEPSNTATRRQLVTQYVAAGDLENAGRLLDADTAATDPDLLLALGQIELARKDDAAARSTLTRFVVAAPERGADVLRLAGELGRGGEPERAFACIEIVVDDAVLRGDWDRAIDVVQSFLVHGPHLPALVKLVQIAAEAGHDEVLQEAQERLADAYIETGQGEKGRAVTEALLVRAPESSVHAARLRRAFELSGEGDPDDAVRNTLTRLGVGHSAVVPESVPVAIPEDDVLVPEMDVLVPEVDVMLTEPPNESGVNEIAFEFEDIPIEELLGGTAGTGREKEAPTEIDLSSAIAAIGGTGTHTTAPGPGVKAAGGVVRTAAEAAEIYERALHRLETGQVREGLADLEDAARVPALRFQASARLAREYVRRGHTHAAIQWLEHAADVAAPTREDGLAVLYELGVALDAVGESTRALAVLLEVEADQPGYRDVQQRLEALSKAEDERRG